MNGILKNHLTKLSLEQRVSWPELLLLALACIRATPPGPTFMSPFELMYGRPFLLNHSLPSEPPPLASYLPYLSFLRHLFYFETGLARLMRVSLFSETVLEPMILLSQPPKYWDYKHVSPRPARI